MPVSSLPPCYSDAHLADPRTKWARIHRPITPGMALEHRHAAPRPGARPAQLSEYARSLSTQVSWSCLLRGFPGERDPQPRTHDVGPQAEYRPCRSGEPARRDDLKEGIRGRGEDAHWSRSMLTSFESPPAMAERG